MQNDDDDDEKKEERFKILERRFTRRKLNYKGNLRYKKKKSNWRRTFSMCCKPFVFVRKLFSHSWKMERHEKYREFITRIWVAAAECN